MNNEVFIVVWLDGCDTPLPSSVLCYARNSVAVYADRHAAQQRCMELQAATPQVEYRVLTCPVL